MSEPKRDYNIPVQLLFIAKEYGVSLKELCDLLDILEEKQLPAINCINVIAAKEALEEVLERVEK